MASVYLFNLYLLHKSCLLCDLLSAPMCLGIDFHLVPSSGLEELLHYRFRCFSKFTSYPLQTRHLKSAVETIEIKWDVDFDTVSTAKFIV